jgi:hypothetical protein
MNGQRPARHGPASEEKIARRVDPASPRSSRDQKREPWPVETGGSPASNQLEAERDTTMRFMMLMIPNAKAEAGALPDAKAVAAMMKYNEDLAKAGALLALDGLHPSSKGARISFSGGKRTVADGPFTEAKEVIGGYWLIQVKSKEEAIAWASRCPADDGNVIEVRQVFEMSDFPPDVQKAAGDTPALSAQLEQRRSS